MSDNNKIPGLIHSTESFGSVDGPGVRFVVFMQGCRMRCLYCHNPDTWTPDKGRWITSQELLERAVRYRSYWGKNGGITVSGGEPLLQIDFLIEFFRAAKDEGINTALDTSGNPFTFNQPFFEKFNTLMQYVDLVILDIKEIDDKAHTALTGRTNSNILKMAEYLSSVNKPMWIRHVLVPGVTDSAEHLSKLGDFIRTLSSAERTEILPYHMLGEYKWKELGLKYKLSGVIPPDDKDILRAKRLIGIE